MSTISKGKLAIWGVLLAMMFIFVSGIAPASFATDSPMLVSAEAIDDLLGDVQITDDGGLDVGITEDGDTDFNGILGRYKTIIVAITGFLTVTMFGMMIFMFTKLGVAGDNEMARRKAIGGILTTGIATALLGGATIVIGFFYGAISGTDSGAGGGT